MAARCARVVFNGRVPPIPPAAPDDGPRATALTLDLTVMSLPVRLELAAVDTEVERAVRGAWSRCLAPEPIVHPVITVRFPDAGHRSPGELLSEISTRVTLEAIIRWRGHRLLFHAAGLADPDTGRTSILVAASGTGKTTAARTLGTSLAYLGDETMCVDPEDLGVAAYPKPLSVPLRNGHPKRQVSPDEVGLLPQSRPARLHHVLLLDRDPHGPPGEVGPPLPLSEALSRLAPNISALPSLPAPLSTLIDVLRRVGGARLVRYRDIRTVRTLLTTLTASPAVPCADRSPLRSWRAPAPADAPDARDVAPPPSGDDDAAPPPRVRCAPWVEAVENPEDPEQLIILLAERLVVVGGLAPAVWHACREQGERELGELVTAVVAAHGENPRATSVVARRVRDLVAAGVLEPAT